MKYKEDIKLKGEWQFIVEDREGNKKIHTYQNVITMNYRNFLVNAMGAIDGAKDRIEITHEQLGTSSTPADQSQIDLQAPNSGTLQLITSTATQNNVITTTSFWDEGQATGHWREFGLLNILNGNRLLINRVNIDVNVLSTNKLTVIGTITLNI